jgi:hypothetical protein
MNLFKMVDIQRQVNKSILQLPKYQLKSHDLSLLPFMERDNQEFHIKYLFFYRNELTIRNQLV